MCTCLAVYNLFVVFVIVLLYTTRAVVIWIFFGCQRISSVAGCSAWAGFGIWAEGAGLSDAQQFDVRGSVALGPIDECYQNPRGYVGGVSTFCLCLWAGLEGKAEDV